MKCQRELPADFDEMPRQPCPECGSTVRGISRDIKEALALSDSVSRTQLRPGLQSMAENHDHGTITLTADGPAPQNEEDVQEVCERLVRMFNSIGGTWSVPVEAEMDVDRRSTNDDGDTLEMQVIRAKIDGRFWEAVNTTGSATVG
jgi:hypothetical protein